MLNIIKFPVEIRCFDEKRQNVTYNSLRCKAEEKEVAKMSTNVLHFINLRQSLNCKLEGKIL